MSAKDRGPCPGRVGGSGWAWGSLLPRAWGSVPSWGTVAEALGMEGLLPPHSPGPWPGGGGRLGRIGSGPPSPQLMVWCLRVSPGLLRAGLWAAVPV